MGERWDVVVVGAGPVGLAAAAEVAGSGSRVLVVDRRGEPSRASRAFGVHARTLELLDQRGLAQDLLSTGPLVPRLLLPGGAGVDLSRLPTRFPGVLVTPQTHVDAALERRAVARGARIERGTTVTGLEELQVGVRVSLATAGGGREVEAAWVVAADGVRSTVRGLLDLPFPGRTVLRSVALADVRLGAPPPDGLAIGASRDGFAFVAPFGDGWFRVIAWDRHDERPDDAPVDPAWLARTVRDAMGADLGLGEARWSSRFHSDERQVPRYRVGRVFLAGDAAHVHSPAGGQGMNTGIQDAVNLGWKLRAVIEGAAPGLLETYHDERHPVGRTVLATSGAALRAVTADGVLARALRTVVVGGVLRLPPVGLRAASTISGIGISYGRRRGEHRAVGRRAEDVPLVGGRGLHDVLDGEGFVLVHAHGAERAGGRALTPEGVRPFERAGRGPALLVRPDGHVAWAGDGRGTGDGAGWRDALRRWGGPAGRTPVPGGGP